MTPFLNDCLMPNGSVAVVFGDSAAVDVVTGCQGYVATFARGTTSSVAGSDLRANAVRYTSTGVLRMYDATASVPAGAVIVDGFAVTSDGQLCYTTDAPSGPAYIGGIAVKQNGAIHVTDVSMAAWYRAGVGQTDAGSGACSAWADQSGNGRDLLQGTGANRPVIQADGSILFNGTSQFLKTAAFTLNQPTTIYLAFKQITWTSSDYILDGDLVNTGGFAQTNGGVSPQLQLFAGAGVASNSDLPLDTLGVATIVFNGASSLLQINSGTELTGNAGAGNMGGITLGASGTGASIFSNIQVWELIVRATSEDAATRLRFQQYLANKYGITL